MKIGNQIIKGRAVLAPMAGVTDLPFRQLCASFGAAYVVTEMVSAKALSFSDRKSDALMELAEQEHPAAIQIFGDDPEIMAQAARLACAHRPDMIDINMGCPAPKIANNGSGSALMKNPDLCGRIVEAVKKR
ncbi:MAG: tRNA dihydrouridine synthase [Clostridium sp.]